MSIKVNLNCYPYVKTMKTMNSELKHIDFSLYTFEEFLQNDFFISSMKYPTEETREFWSDFEQANPSNIKEFIAAKECMKAISVADDDFLSNRETDDLWTRIQATNLNKEKAKRKNYFLIGLSAAASVAILVGCFFFLKNYPSVLTPDIATFAVQAKAELPETEEALLILAEDNIVNLKERESEITYDSVEIKTNQESILKEKVATYNQLVIPRGKRSVLTFADGSKVWVNAGTRVVYPVEFEKDKREIYVDGEIYIEVARDENRPFYVRTKDMNVRVLGTKFNVTAYESETIRSVVLAQGCVQVETAQTPKAILAPNQMFSSAEGKENITQVDVEQAISWINGLYCFQSADLGIVLKRLSTYYGINVDFDPALSKIKCSGKIDLKDKFETVMNGLTFVAPISYAYDEQYKTYRVVKK